MIERIRIFSVFTLMACFLTACSIPISVNLLEAFPGAASGSFDLPLPDGSIDLLPRITKPTDSIDLPLNTPIPVTGVSFPELAIGVPIDLGDEDVPTLIAATLSYSVEVAANGPVSGVVRVQPYLAPGEAAQAASGAYALGEAQRISLSADLQTLQASVVLNEAQLNAISEKSLQLALGVAGESINLSPGQAGVRYAFKTLELDIERVRSEVTEYFPDENGKALDFSDQEVPGPGSVKTLGIAYRVVIESGANLGGDLKGQVYIAPPLEPGQSDADAPLFSEAHLFGKEQSLNLDATQIVLEDSAALKGAQEEVIRSKKLRIGVLVIGEAEVSLGQSAKLAYSFSKLELAGGYSLF